MLQDSRVRTGRIAGVNTFFVDLCASEIVVLREVFREIWSSWTTNIILEVKDRHRRALAAVKRVCPRTIRPDSDASVAWRCR